MFVFSARIQEKRPWLADMKQAVNAMHLQYSAESETRVAKALHVESLITGRAIWTHSIELELRVPHFVPCFVPNIAPKKAKDSQRARGLCRAARRWKRIDK